MGLAEIGDPAVEDNRGPKRKEGVAWPRLARDGPNGVDPGCTW